ncbi:MAG: HD-GYP domain-containing protein [Gemmatimonadaceae bacterium]|nr:HD-GYP domain-containing protein [Gemmatimonadaceae bacterium]
MDHRVRSIVEKVAVGALVALAAFLALGPEPTIAEWRAAAFFAGFGVLASALAYRTSQATLGTIGFLPYLSAALVAPNIAALVSVLVSTLAAELFLRRPLVKLVFNVSQHIFSVALGIGAYLALGGSTALNHTPGAIPFLALVAVYFTLNKLAVSTVVAASDGSPTKAHWVRSMRGSVLYDALAFPLILFFAVAYSNLGAGWSAILALPMLGMRQLYRTVFALQKVNEELLQLMVASIEARDPYTSGHSQRVARYARVIAKHAGMGVKAVERTEIAALLHDVGKIHEEFAVILRKPGRLTDEEFEVMKTHPGRSAELVGRVSHFADLVPAVQSHHESWDGRGYPHSLKGADIPLGARVIALADTIDAMTTSRPYRAALTPDDVKSELHRERGRQFDPAICERLLTPAAWSELTREIESATIAFPVHGLSPLLPIEGTTGEFLAVASSR